MKTTSKKLFALLLAVAMIACTALPVFAEDANLPYDGDAVSFIKADGSPFGMFTAQEGTTAVLKGGKVVIHYVPKNTTVYNALHWGKIDDAELTRDVEFNEDGTFDLTLSKDVCGTAVPVAPIKVKDGGTTSDQYYLAIPAADKLERVATEPFAYTGDAVSFIKADGSPFGMFTAQEGTSAVLDGDNVVIHYVPKNTTVYNALHFGSIDDAELTKDVTFNEDGTFDLTLSKDKCGFAVPVAPIKVKDGGTTSDQYYLAIPAADKLQAAAPAAEGDALTITNTTSMFKADSARLEGDTLVVALTGTTYHYLFPGTYEQAVENGDKREVWIAGAVNAAGKWEFRIPVAADQTVIPVVSISNTYLTKYEAGENALERAFYPRQFVLDREAKSLTVGDYESTRALTVTNNVKMFKVDAAALETVGGPNSNNYKAALSLTMGSDSFDRAYVGRAADIAENTETVALGEGRVFSLPVKWVADFGKPETLVSLLDKPFVVSFHSVSKDAWYERVFTVNEKDGVLTIDEAPAFADVAIGKYYTAPVAWAVKNGVTTGATETAFAPDATCTRAQVVTFLWRAAGKPAASGTNPFTDVKEGDYFYDAVLWAVENGVTTGLTETSFGPGAPCTREQVVTFLWRAAGKPAASGTNPFTDVKQGDYSYDAVLWAVENGITTGAAETSFAPKATCTRAQIVTFLFRQYSKQA